MVSNMAKWKLTDWKKKLQGHQGFRSIPISNMHCKDGFELLPWDAGTKRLN